MRYLMIALILLMAAPAVAEDARRRITVVGKGSVEAIPDMATIAMGVISEAKTGATAMSQNSDILTEVMTQLNDAGLNARDIQTSNLSLSPRWGKTQSNSNGQRDVAGFVASNTVTVRVRDLDKLGAVLDAVVQNGANKFNGLNFGLQEPQPAQDAARKAAVADALRKAQLYALAAGVTLGDVMTISDAPQHDANILMMALEGSVQADGVLVSQGEVSVAASVTVVYAIAD